MCVIFFVFLFVLLFLWLLLLFCILYLRFRAPHQWVKRSGGGQQQQLYSLLFLLDQETIFARIKYKFSYIVSLSNPFSTHIWNKIHFYTQYYAELFSLSYFITKAYFGILLFHSLFLCMRIVFAAFECISVVQKMKKLKRNKTDFFFKKKCNDTQRERVRQSYKEVHIQFETYFILSSHFVYLWMAGWMDECVRV